jgi:glyoxylase-like metal-dependent hydrolase (beta-lactamase superfamily II)
MKIEQISGRIWALKTWAIFPIQMWVVKEEAGVTLVDAGMPFMAKGILRFIETLDAGPLRRILLTHGHTDHVGAIRTILKQHDVPVYAHPTEIPYMEGKLPYPGRKKAVSSLPPGLAQPLPAQADGQLQPIAGLLPLLTPGHSPGHIVYYDAKERILLAGDLFNAKRGKLRKPMFTFDMPLALESSRIVQELDPLRLEVSHGGSVFRPAQQLADYWKENERFVRANGK